jgi:hypothetical protein
MICRYCGNVIRRDRRPRGLAAPTGWTHDSSVWLGRRCPNGSRYAEPLEPEAEPNAELED